MRYSKIEKQFEKFVGSDCVYNSCGVSCFSSPNDAEDEPLDEKSLEILAEIENDRKFHLNYVVIDGELIPHYWQATHELALIAEWLGVSEKEAIRRISDPDSRWIFPPSGFGKMANGSLDHVKIREVLPF